MKENGWAGDETFDLGLDLPRGLLDVARGSGPLRGTIGRLGFKSLILAMTYVSSDNSPCRAAGHSLARPQSAGVPPNGT